MSITRVVSGLWGGKKAGSFAGKTLSSGRPSHAAHDVISGLWGGKTHSSFAGKATATPSRPDHASHDVISGLWGGRAHGSFLGKAVTETVVSESYSGGWIEHGTRRTKRDIQEARRKYGLAFDVVEKVAKRQVEDLHLDDLQRTEELVRELELKSIEYDSRYLELLNDYRDELMNSEISRLLKEKMLVEEQELLLLLAAALSIN